jgi:hypothetical protein
MELGFPYMDTDTEMICEFCDSEISRDDFDAGFVRVSDTHLVNACARCRFIHSAVFVNSNGAIEVMSIGSRIWQDENGHIHGLKKISR